jgi:carbamate kinase
MKMLIALGGNAILQENEKGTFEEQDANIDNTAKHLAKIIKMGHDIVVTHGNGPQVGDILLRYELSKNNLPVMPLHVCGGESQGMMGYMIAQSIRNELNNIGVEKEVECILTQTIVDKNDEHFKNPSKPIGPFYEKEEADKLSKDLEWTLIIEDNKYRRVVASPIPIDIVEFNTIKHLSSNGDVVICTGGGGVPVIKDGKELKGVDAVIDKDLASSLLAKKLNVDLFIILTDVDHAFLDYKKSTQRVINKMTLQECSKYLSDGQFENGTMKPKIQAAMEFVKATGNKAIITSLANTENAIENNFGTLITVN